MIAPQLEVVNVWGKVVPLELAARWSRCQGRARPHRWLAATFFVLDAGGPAIFHGRRGAYVFGHECSRCGAARAGGDLDAA